MIILKSIGGLGNQLFQLAFAIKVAKELNEEKIYVDTSSFKTYKIRSFKLDNFKINDSLIYLDENYLNKKVILSQKIYRLYQKIVKTIKRHNKIGNSFYQFIAKKGFLYNFDIYFYETPFNQIKNNDIYIYGYFQSELYFKDVDSIIQKEFRVKTEPTINEKKLLKKMNSSTSVGISMRVGKDYETSKIFDVYNEEFYKKSMDYIAGKIGNVSFFVFSDDIEKVKKDFIFDYPVTYVEGFNEYESLRLLYSCDHFIISNSSFSWWGAYLGTNKDKLILTGEKWYINKKDKPDIYYKGMTKI